MWGAIYRWLRAFADGWRSESEFYRDDLAAHARQRERGAVIGIAEERLRKGQAVVLRANKLRPLEPGPYAHEHEYGTDLLRPALGNKPHRLELEAKILELEAELENERSTRAAMVAHINQLQHEKALGFPAVADMHELRAHALPGPTCDSCPYVVRR